MLWNIAMGRKGRKRGTIGMMLTPVLAWWLAACTLHAQRIGASVGYETGMWLYRADLYSTASRSTERGAAGMTWRRESRWYDASFSFPRLLGSDTELEFGMAGGVSTGTNRRYLPDVQVLNTIPPSDSIISVVHRVRSDIDYHTSSLRAHLMARYSLYGPIVLEGGAWGQHRTAGSYDRSLRLTEPANARFINEEGYRSAENGRVLFINEDTTFSSPAFSWGGILGAGCDIPLTASFILHSSIRLHGDFGRMKDELSWHSLALGANIGLRFDLDPPEDPAAAIPSGPGTDSRAVPERAPLRASIDLYSEGAGGERVQSLPVRRRAETTTQHLPFVPAVYFADGDDRIPERYNLLAPDAGDFTADSLAGRDFRWLHYQGLNVLGMRLKEEAKEKISLLGLVGPGEPAGLGRRRAERVRGYLRDRWKVEERRVSVAERHGDAGAVIASGLSPALAGPVVSEWSVAGLDAPQIGLRPATDGGAGLKRWEIGVWLGERRIATYSSDGPAGEEMIDMGMVLDGLHEGAAPDLVAELTVEDSAGAIVVSKDRLPVRLEPPAGPGRKQATYLLLVPESAPLAVPVPELESIAAVVGAGNRITVRYPASGPQRDDATATYASHVAESLATLLRSRGTGDAAPVLAPEKPLQTKGMPEERLFRSAITVVVE